jgi:hypothetical protein
MDITMRNICECQKQFMEDQVKEIEKYKWIVSERAGRDLGREACMDWIAKHAKLFREYWFSTHN